ncbi:hypothetical protein NX059_005977 [Plenodomus lindquistii]|nr:hypothetical protein NX059_005977 [Plenodomus lindquistii]
MRFTSVLSSIALMAAQVQTGFGSPITGKQLARRVDCDDVSKYSIDYFMDNKIVEPEASTCLFYTAWLSAIAKRFAHSGGASMTTIWDMWSCDHYNGDKSSEDNRLRCIFSEDSARIEYFSHMSEAMAISCDNFATVMTNFTDNVPQDGIWGTVEQPALQRTGNPGGQVDTIIAADLQGGNIETIWERPGTLKMANGTAITASSMSKRSNMMRSVPLEKRQEGTDRCYSPDQIQEWFGSVPW